MHRNKKSAGLFRDTGALRRRSYGTSSIAAMWLKCNTLIAQSALNKNCIQTDPCVGRRSDGSAQLEGQCPADTPYGLFVGAPTSSQWLDARGCQPMRTRGDAARI